MENNKLKEVDIRSKSQFSLIVKKFCCCDFEKIVEKFGGYDIEFEKILDKTLKTNVCLIKAKCCSCNSTISFPLEKMEVLLRE